MLTLNTLELHFKKLGNEVKFDDENLDGLASVKGELTLSSMG